MDNNTHIFTCNEKYLEDLYLRYSEEEDLFEKEIILDEFYEWLCEFYSKEKYDEWLRDAVSEVIKYHLENLNTLDLEEEELADHKESIENLCLTIHKYSGGPSCY